VATEWSPSKCTMSCVLFISLRSFVWEEDDRKAVELPSSSYVMCQHFNRSTTLSTASMG